jgi:hypothetical protein
MRRFASFTIVFVLLLSSALFAQSKSALNKPKVEPVPEMQRASLDEVKAMFEAMNLKQQSAETMRAMQTQLVHTFETEMNKQTPPPTTRQLQEFRTMMNEAMATVRVEDLIDDMASIYQKYLTRDEIVAIRTFYSSPEGKSMLVKMPTILGEYMQVSLPKEVERMKAALDALQEKIKKMPPNGPAKQKD